MNFLKRSLFSTVRYSLALLCICIFWTNTTGCTGTDYGIDGPDVISREEAIQKIEMARLSRFAACNQVADIQVELINNSGKKDRDKLDGAFYATRDVDSCVRSVFRTPCENPVLNCKLAPKDFLKGSLLQGGF